MENNNINYLLQKYSKPYVNGEVRTPEYEKQIKQNTNTEEKIRIAEDLFQQVPFHLTNPEKEQVRHLIRMYPNFRKLHGNASNETIILAFIFYTKIPYNTDIKIDKYQITKIYQLTHSTFELIICRLALEYLKEVYIIPYTSENTKHEILTKGEEK